jgi:hypothetical protein
MEKLLPAVYRAITSPVRVLPDFAIIGGQKCGTSSLYEYLAEHPDIVPAFAKEIHFFSDSLGRRGTLPGKLAARLGGRSTLIYRAHFPTAAYRTYVRRARGSEPITGEATPYYLFHPSAPARMRQTVPRARLVVLLRDPVQRAYSHYHHEVRRGTERLSFEEAVEREPERLAGEREKILSGRGYYSFSHHHYSYLSRGLYLEQLENWRRFFPEERFLILKSEDLFADPAAILEQTLDFLGLPPMQSAGYGRRNEGSYPEMNPATRERLANYFRPHNERLYEYLGRDFSWEL